MPANDLPQFSRRSLAVSPVALGAMTVLRRAVHADEQPGASPEASPAADSPTLLLRLETVSGPDGLGRLLGAVPDFSLYDDGSIYRLGPVIAIFPPPALPNVTRMRVSAKAVEMVMERARLAGLDQARDIPNPTMDDDSPSTRFWFNAGDRIEVSVAWGIFAQVEPLPEWDEATLTAYRQLRELVSYLANLPFNLPEKDVLEAEIPIDPERLQVIAFEASADQALPPEVADPGQPPLTWPLTTPLAELARPYDLAASSFPEGSCAILSGDAARAVVETARQGNLLSPWVDGDTTYGVRLLPLLPDQAGCEASRPE